MLNNRDGTNEKPRDRAGTHSQGQMSDANHNSTTFKDSRSRYDKGLELYKSGKVSIGKNGLFKVSGYYEADTERVTCTCPDYKTRKESCKHLFAAMLFVKNRGKQSIEDLEGHSHGAPSNKPVDAPKQADSKGFDRQATITRLAVLNTATEALKSYCKPITAQEIIEYAAQLEKWALGR